LNLTNLFDKNLGTQITIERAISLAQTHQGKCLSKELANGHSLLKWMCSVGHTWDASFYIVQQGGWCPQCFKKQQKLLAVSSIAEEYGGICLSEVYKNAETELLFKCRSNHQFYKTPSQLKKKQWCSVCADLEYKESRLTLMRSIAKQRSGKCLSLQYVHVSSKLLWECAEGHRWTAVANNVQNGSWCPHCAQEIGNEKQRISIREIKKIAEKYDGFLLSAEYKNTQSVLKWKCKFGHTWHAALSVVLYRKSWCPTCREDSYSFKTSDYE
jgi:hypothetical protein